MNIEQMDLFNDDFQAHDEGTVQELDGLRRTAQAEVLNGFYYEQNSGLFVSFARGRRYFETDGNKYPAEWKSRLKKERAIE